MALTPGASASLALSLIIAVGAVTVVMLLQLRILEWPCPAGTLWDEASKVCRKPCTHEGEARGATYNPAKKQCECATLTYPLANSITGLCERKCPPGVPYDPLSDSCIMPGLTSVSSCSPMPQVDSVTGVVSDSTHFLQPPDYKVCSQGTTAQLDTLCKASECAMPGVCEGGDRFDGYDSTTKKCKKDTPCDQRACTAVYCTSASVTNALGPVVQMKQANGTCANPSEATVSAACTSLPSKFWNSPASCFNSAPTSTLVFTPGTETTTTKITGTITVPLLVNAEDWPLTFYYTLTLAQVQVTSAFTVQPSVEWLPGGVGVYTGALAREEPARLTGTNDPVASGIMTYTASTVATTSAFAVTITLPPNLTSNAYTLSITGRPQWDTTKTLYTLTSGSGGVNLFLVPAADSPGVKAGMAPVVLIDDAVQLAKTASWVSSVLTTLSTSNPTTFQLDATMTALPVSDPASSTSKVLLAGCTPTYCIPSPTQVSQKLAVITWRKITATQLTASGCTATATVNYMLQRSMTSSSGVTTRTVLITPSTQPLSNLLSTVSVLSFVDVLPIRATGQYILGAYVGTSYDASVCKSPLLTLSFDTTDYSDAFCQTVTPQVTSPLPPWMWRDASTGMCTYTANSIPARDFYCMFDFNKSTRGLDATNLALGSNVRSTCGAVSKAYPSSGTAAFASATCNPPQYPAATCITGATENATVKCPVKVDLQNAGTGSNEGSISFTDFSQRVTAALDWGKMHASIPTSATDGANSLASATTQATLWGTVYNRCGPQASPDQWAVSAAACPAGDATCASVAAVSGCGRNVCQPWTCVAGCDDTSRASLGYSTYQRTRQCYPGSVYDGAASVCCSNKGVYSLDTSKSTARGTCSGCTTGFGGNQCQSEPCLGVTCNGHGTCMINEKNEAYCQCDTANRWFNIGATRSMNNKLDCATVPAGCDPSQPGCYVVPFSCRCPKLCSQAAPGDRSCVLDQPLTCNQTYNVSANATGCDCPECEFTPDVKAVSKKYVDPQANKFYDIYKDQPLCLASASFSTPASVGAGTYENLNGDGNVGVNAQCCSGLAYNSSKMCVPVYDSNNGGLYCKYLGGA